MKSPARLVVGVALSLLLCSLLQCAAGQGAEAEEMMRLPINFGDGNAPQTLEVAMRQLRSPGPIAVATAFLRGKGFGERKEFPELVSALAQLLVSRYNEIADARSQQAQSAQSSQRRVLAEVPITLGNGQEVTMVHYESSTAVDTVVSFCKAAGITYSAYSPLGGVTKYDVLHDPVATAIGAAHNRSSAQVALRYLTQRGIPLITASDKEAHVASDLASFELTLSDGEMAALIAA